MLLLLRYRLIPVDRFNWNCVIRGYEMFRYPEYHETGAPYRMEYRTRIWRGSSETLATDAQSAWMATLSRLIMTCHSEVGCPLCQLRRRFSL